MLMKNPGTSKLKILWKNICIFLVFLCKIFKLQVSSDFDKSETSNDWGEGGFQSSLSETPGRQSMAIFVIIIEAEFEEEKNRPDKLQSRGQRESFFHSRDENESFSDSISHIEMRPRISDT